MTTENNGLTPDREYAPSLEAAASNSLAATQKKTAKVPDALKQAWRETKAIYEKVRADPTNPQHKGTFTKALRGERESLDGKSVLEALTRLKLHTALRRPHVHRHKKRGTEKWMQFHYDMAKVETAVNEELFKKIVLPKLLIDDSATLWAIKKHKLNPTLPTGKRTANIETYISTVINNAVIDYLWTIEYVPVVATEIFDAKPAAETDHETDGKKESADLPPRRDVEFDLKKYAQARDNSGDDDPVFSAVDLKQTAEAFLTTLSDEAQRAVFWVVVMNGHSVAAAAQLLDIGVETCEARLDVVEGLWGGPTDAQHWVNFL